MAVVILAANSRQALGFCLFAGLSFLMETLAYSGTVSIAIPKSSLPGRSMLLFLWLCGLVQRPVRQFEMDQCFSPKETQAVSQDALLSTAGLGMLRACCG